MDATPRTTAAPEPARPADKDAAKKDTDTGVLVRTVWPVDHLEHGLKGVDTITAAGIRIPKSKVKALHDAAAAAGTTLVVED